MAVRSILTTFFFHFCRCLVITNGITMRNRGHFTKPMGVIMFASISPFYYSYISLMAIYAHFRELCLYSSWNPTARSTTKTS
jgi:hypothetical protein